MFFCCFALYLLVYFPLVLRNGLHWDEVLDVAGAANGTYVAAGRWGMALYRQIFGLGYMPWTAGVVAGLYISAALVIQTRFLGINTTPGQLWYAVLYIGCVQWAAQLHYSFQCDAVALALLCMSGAASLLGSGTRKTRVAAILLMVYACAVYQTAMLYLLVLVMLGFLSRNVSLVPSWKKVVGMFGTIFLAGILYLMSSYAAKMLPVLSAADLAYMRAVQHGMSKWPEIASAATLSEMCSLLAMYAVCYIKAILKNLLGLAYEGQWVYATAMLPLAGLLWHYGKARNHFQVILLLLVWLTPFIMALVVMTHPAARVNLAEPLALAGLWSMWLKCAPGLFRRHRRLVVLLAALLLLKSSYRCSAIAEDEKNLYLSKINNLHTLNTRILALADAEDMADPRVIYFGQVPVAGVNLYTSRWAHRRDPELLLKLPTGPFPEELTVPLRQATPAEAAAYQEILVNMPVWPHPACVKRAGGVILVRFAA